MKSIPRKRIQVPWLFELFCKYTILNWKLTNRRHKHLKTFDKITIFKISRNSHFFSGSSSFYYHAYHIFCISFFLLRPHLPFLTPTVKQDEKEVNNHERKPLIIQIDIINNPHVQI